MFDEKHETAAQSQRKIPTELSKPKTVNRSLLRS